MNILSQTKSSCKLLLMGCPVPRVFGKFKILISEPTSNIAPKSPGGGRKFYGGEVVSPFVGEIAFLTCQVAGYPVPIFR